MTRLLTEGFEEQVLIDKPWVLIANGGFGIGRGGGGSSLYLWGGHYWETLSDFNVSEVFVRVAVYAAYGGQLILKSDQGDEFYVKVLGNGYATLSKYNPATPSTPTLLVTGTKYLNARTWYSVEIRYAMPGTVTVKIEGVQDLTYSQGSAPHSGTTIKSFKVYNLGDDFVLDDLAINSADSGADGSWVGDAKIIRLKPTGDVSGSIQWARQPTSGFSSNYQLLTSPAADTNYVRSDTSGDIDWYTVEAANLSPNSQIKRAWVAAVAREETALGDILTLGVRVGSSGAPTWTAKTLNSNWNVHNSAEQTFSVSDANNLQVGIKVGL